MTKQEFLETMRLALNGKVASGQVMENLRFYEDYINTEIRKGKTEEEVLAQLGDPRLLARTIVETGGGSGGPSTGEGFFGESGQADRYGESSTWYGSGDEEYQQYGRPERRRGQLLAKVPVWAWLVLVFLIIILILSAVFSVIAALLPILLPILIVMFLVKAFRDWFH